MSHYTVRGYPDVAAQYVVAAVSGYFHSIACAANAKGVDDSLQVNSIGYYRLPPSIPILACIKFWSIGGLTRLKFNS